MVSRFIKEMLNTARVLRVSPTTVIEELKKDRHLEQVNTPLLQQMQQPPKSTWLHDIVIGLFINRYEFGRAI